MAVLARLGLALLLVGCAQTLKWDECTTDADCARLATDGKPLYCTSDRLCVAQLPEERLCPETVSVSGDGPPLVVASLANPADSFDVGVEKAIRLVVKQLKDRRKVELHVCNAGETTEQALRAVKVAVEKYHATAILGPTTSGGTVYLAPWVTQQGVLLISPSATAIEVSALTDNGLIWRTAPSDALQARRLASLVAKDMPAPTKVDTLYVEGVYGKGLADAFLLEYGKAGAMGTFGKAISFSAGGENIPQQVGALAADGPSHAVVIADYDLPTLAPLLGEQAALAATQFLMTDSAKSDALFGTTAKPTPKAVLDRVRGTGPAMPMGEAFTLFRTAYMTEYSTEPSAFTANAYDAAYLVAIAAAATTDHTPSGAELAGALARLKKRSDGCTPLPVTDSKFIEITAAQAAGGVCLAGASGPLEFDEAGDLREGAFEVWAVDTSSTPPRFKTLTTQ